MSLKEGKTSMYYPAGEIRYGQQDSKRMCGNGCIEELEGALASPSLRAAHVKFVDGAYTKWHFHTGEQLLLGTNGKGFVELQGSPISKIGEGDRVLVPKGVWHRHGALDKGTFVHLAVTSGETAWDEADPCQRDSRDADRLGTSVVSDIIDLSRRILDYEEAGATASLAPHLANAFSIVRSSGQKSDRQAFLDAVPANAHRGRNASQANVHLLGQSSHARIVRALHTCMVTITQNPDGSPSSGRFWNTQLFVREGQWRCLTWHVMKIQAD